MKRIMTVLFASALLLAACGGSDSGGSGSGGSSSTGSSSDAAEFNDADVAFAQGMIPHHEQAVEMADLALKSASSEEVKGLAEQIEAEQDPEIKTMKGFLDDWGRQGSGDSGDREGMDGSSDSDMTGITGMMSDQDMADLGAASGAAFDKMFLEMMIEHHTSAITMAETEQADGKNADAKDLAGQIIKAQKAEITEMEALLDSGV